MKDFTPYEEALTLEELGFDEDCLGAYIRKRSNLPVQDLSIGMYNNSDLMEYDSDSCVAPLYQQAFRWFREKYGLHGHLDIEIPKQHESYYRIVINDTSNSRGWLYTTHQYRDKVVISGHEEAELACLKKLIEIVKAT